MSGETPEAASYRYHASKLTSRRVDGAANYRRVPLLLEDGQPQTGEEHYVYGTG